MSMILESARVEAHETLRGDYRLLRLRAPGIAAAAQPGQFVHLRIPGLPEASLRRPFSIMDAERGELSILYKTIGRGTTAMRSLAVGDDVSLLGPLGNGFPLNTAGAAPVLVAGGYGAAPLYFLASRLPVRGIVFIGGARESDILLDADFRRLGWDVRIASEDGTLGTKGLVTTPLDAWLKLWHGDCPPRFYACGPMGMLKAVGQRAAAGGWTAWLSLDRHMGCGVGACLACVQKVRRDGVETLVRVCREGPVFEARDVIWD